MSRLFTLLTQSVSSILSTSLQARLSVRLCFDEYRSLQSTAVLSRVVSWYRAFACATPTQMLLVLVKYAVEQYCMSLAYVKAV
jgi:hypothetical protein